MKSESLGCTHGITSDAVLAEIQRIAREELDLDRPVRAEDALLADLHLDSMAVTVLAVALEDHFRVRLREEDARAVTVGDLAELVAARATEEAA
jgi:acyl carrier protein